MKLYAVAKGSKTGIFDSWEECQEATKGYSDAKFKKCSSFEEAEEYISKFKKVNDDYDRVSVIENYYRASNALMAIGIMENAPSQLKDLALDASRATVKIIDFVNKKEQNHGM